MAYIKCRVIIVVKTIFAYISDISMSPLKKIKLQKGAAHIRETL